MGLAVSVDLQSDTLLMAIFEKKGKIDHRSVAQMNRPDNQGEKKNEMKLNMRKKEKKEKQPSLRSWSVFGLPS